MGRKKVYKQTNLFRENIFLGNFFVFFENSFGGHFYISQFVPL